MKMVMTTMIPVAESLSPALTMARVNFHTESEALEREKYICKQHLIWMEGNYVDPGHKNYLWGVWFWLYLVSTLEQGINDLYGAGVGSGSSREAKAFLTDKPCGCSPPPNLQENLFSFMLIKALVSNSVLFTMFIISILNSQIQPQNVWENIPHWNHPPLNFEVQNLASNSVQLTMFIISSMIGSRTMAGGGEVGAGVVVDQSLVMRVIIF